MNAQKGTSDIIVGLMFGDEGKGTTVDYLASINPEATVIRHSGGGQAAHNVVLPDGRHHTFSQFGSGAFQGARTILSRFVLFNPFSFVEEGRALAPLLHKTPFEDVTVSENALVTTPYHVAMNRLREKARGAGAHGSTAMGIGETQDYANQFPELAIHVRDLADDQILCEKLEAVLEYGRSQFADFDRETPDLSHLRYSYRALREDKVLNVATDDEIAHHLAQGYNIFEGSQGVLLDENYGFHPHTTWATTTQKNAQTLLAEAGLERGNVIGLTRSYTTRHGYGPFPSELKDWRADYPEAHNTYGEFEGDWRVGCLDLYLLEYAIRANEGIDELGMTFLDRPSRHVVTGYQDAPELPTDFFGGDRDEQEAITKALFGLNESRILADVSTKSDLVELTEAAVGHPITFESFGPTARDKRYAR